MAQTIISAWASDGRAETKGNCKVDRKPDNCPICHRGIEPLERWAWFENDRIQVVFQCPKLDCRRLFISYYEKRPEYNHRYDLEDLFLYSGSAPWKMEMEDFHSEIKRISPDFCAVYNEAKEAEGRKLMKICGAGYRKALEFLIKDYLISERKIEKEKIEITSLARCISENIDSDKIKDCAKRAAWLGNDQTHYYKKWIDKDLTDLKGLIELTEHWIVDEHLTNKIREEMPETEKKK